MDDVIPDRWAATVRVRERPRRTVQLREQIERSLVEFHKPHCAGCSTRSGTFESCNQRNEALPDHPCEGSGIHLRY